jgi:hypothetical protein
MINIGKDNKGAVKSCANVIHYGAPDIMLFHNHIVLTVDIMIIDQSYYLLTESRNIQFTTVEKLSDKKRVTLERGLEKVVKLYSKSGFNMAVCLADFKFKITVNALVGLRVTLNTCGPEEYVPEIERNIRSVKMKRFRRLVMMLPFSRLPIIMVVHSVMFSVLWLNFFLPNEGV